ncbi:N-acetylmuramoyl-L-alanine amidase [Gemella haemolysans]|uniref:N-acetylmuramoyl-L-alanine amidase n=1 Tax=Gemella haemolysans ATCC 10379 TaxID=546270 RepID=C5NWE2_9BACL|nr:N-acetylmuramoyl-L-alanine amidase [Gemella haemolysans]EER68480.1 N-acetylmuramoyl-L-alanine amidase [Gemella haemolysans ATCC 10379]KAA8707169.1 N-acetylmuramoyl-L-alanine amidase [Gemella haemolysans]UBH82176.1 N-acetylmuramoyl-L-alanine amidase [Gemella haemolysans]VEI37907.1 N-acetylmuramoyl-L-alanine amidase LytC precursor [Gemella haemolysans]
MKVNKLKLGLGVLTVLATPIAVNTVASSDALAAQGWVKTGNAWYFYNQNGVLARNAWAGNYWLGADGKMVTNAWVDNGRYYVDANGAWVKGVQKPAVAQKQGWVQSGGAWYYYYQGNVVINAWVGNYWLGADGRMSTSSWVDNGRYYVGSNGEWVRNAQKPEEKKQGWVKDSNTWYYYNTDGTLARNKWAGNYWLGADGRMSTNSWVDNGRYYVGSNGEWVRNAQKPEEKKQGWIKESNTWYYYNTDGTLARNKWVGNYWLGADGRMATNSWVDNNRYYVGTNGAWIKDARHPEEKKQGWVKDSNTWYYYNTDGTLARNKWAGNYWLGADGRMSTNSWVDNNRYYVGADGVWVKDASRDKNTKRAIFLDPGHGGSDSGAVENGVREKDLTLSVYNKVSSRLASLGYTVLTSRNTDKDVGLVSRADQANKSNADMFLSIHFNAGGRGTAYGIETYYYKHEQGYEPEINKDNHNSPERIEKSRKLANKIQQNLLYKTGAYDRGVKRASFAVLRETSIPSILVELGFIDNQEEVNKIKTNEYQEKLADGIVDGIVEYYK